MTPPHSTPRTELEERLRFERLIADLSSKFIDLPVGEVDRMLDFEHTPGSGLARDHHARRASLPPDLGRYLVRVFTNPYDTGEIWAPSMGTGLRVGWLTEPRPTFGRLGDHFQERALATGQRRL